MKVKIPRIKIPEISANPLRLLKVLITAGYIFFCAFILLPQVDYQEWYPDSLSKYDINLSAQFHNHQKLVIDKEINDLDAEGVRKIVDRVYTRANAADISSIYVKNTDKTLTLHFADDVSQGLLDTIIKPGKVEMLQLPPAETPETPETDQDSENTEENNADEAVQPSESQGEAEEETQEPPTPAQDPMRMFDRNNYNYTGIKPSEFRDARITQVQENNVYIEIETNADQIEKITEISENDSTFAVFHNGQLLMSYLFPPNDVNIIDPIIIVQMDPNIAKVLASDMLHKPLDIGNLEYEIEESHPIFESELLLAMLGALAVFTIVGLGYKKYYKKENWNVLAGTLLLIGGLLAVIKMSNLVFSLPLLILITLIVGFLAISHYRYYSRFAIALILAGFGFGLAKGPFSTNAFKMLIVSGIYITGFYILLFFVKIYEDK
jgi:hypothetical protein